MANVQKWEEELNWLPSDELKEIENALFTLENCDIFIQEYPETKSLRLIVKNVYTNRVKK